MSNTDVLTEAIKTHMPAALAPHVLNYINIQQQAITEAEATIEVLKASNKKLSELSKRNDKLVELIKEQNRLITVMALKWADEACYDKKEAMEALGLTEFEEKMRQKKVKEAIAGQ